MKANYKKLHRKVKCPDCGIKVSKAKLAFHRLRKHGVKSGNYLKGLPESDYPINVSAPNAPWDNHASKESAYKGGFNEGRISSSNEAVESTTDKIKSYRQYNNQLVEKMMDSFLSVLQHYRDLTNYNT